MKERLRGWARQIKRDGDALYLAAQDRRVPWYAKAAAIAVAAYALSPIDLIPDFIPVVGYLDDLLIVPLGILLAVKLVPSPLMEEFRAAAVSADGERALGKWAAAIVVILWLLGLTMAAIWIRRLMNSSVTIDVLAQIGSCGTFAFMNSVNLTHGYITCTIAR